jgi:hypothetical protein
MPWFEGVGLELDDESRICSSFEDSGGAPLPVPAVEGDVGLVVLEQLDLVVLCAWPIRALWVPKESRGRTNPTDQ